MEKKLLKIKLFFALVLFACAVIYNGRAEVFAAEDSGEASDEKLDTLIAQLPEVTDTLGTGYYYYNQLNDVEKVIYWKLQEATWEEPSVTIQGVEDYTFAELESMQYRAMTALMADKPLLTMYWKDYNEGELNENGTLYTITLQEHEIKSEYMVEK